MFPYSKYHTQKEPQDSVFLVEGGFCSVCNPSLD